VPDERRAGGPAGERSAGEPSPGERSARDRDADHAAIDRLAGDLLPALVAKLAETGLAEIEIREGSWRVRVRRPAGEGASHARRMTDRPSRAQPGHAGHGHQPAGFEGHRSSKEPRDSRESRAGGGNPTNGSTPGLVPVGPGAERAGAERSGAERPDAPAPDEAAGLRTIATSPAVGVYQPRADARPGSRVRAGDRLGAVDMLGVPQEVVAPIDGIVGASLVEPGQAVEYGQDLVVIERGDDTGPGGAGDARPSRKG
jgi:biotin carboxyl carrier protein